MNSVWQEIYLLYGKDRRGPGIQGGDEGLSAVRGKR